MLRSTTKCTRALLSSARRASILNPQLEEVDNNLSKIIEVTDFAKEVENSQSKLVVAFYATWCAPSSKYIQNLESAIKNTKGVKLAKVDIDKNEDATRKYKILATPTVFAMNPNGEVASGHVIGYRSEDEVLNNIKEWFNVYKWVI